MKQKFEKLDKNMKNKDLNYENYNFPDKHDITAHFMIQNVAFAKEEFRNSI